MALTKNAKTGIWQIDLQVAGAARIRRSAGTTSKGQAQALHTKLERELFDRVRLGNKPERTFEDACEQMLSVSEGAKDYDTKLRHVEHWLGVFRGRTLNSIRADEIAEAIPTHTHYTDARRQKPLANATKNRHLSTIKRIMSVAHKLDWVNRIPSMVLRPEKKINVRWITPDEAQSLVAGCTQGWLRDIVEFALLTGMRQGEMTNLDWANVNIERAMLVIGAADSKSGHARAVPLNEQACAVLLRIRGTHPQFVFTRCGHQITDFDNVMFQRAVTSAGLVNFKFHDCRHTWASWLAQGGTPLLTLQKLGGWQTIQMVMKYAHLSPDNLTEFAGKSAFQTKPLLSLVQAG